MFRDQNLDNKKIGLKSVLGILNTFGLAALFKLPGILGHTGVEFEEKIPNPFEKHYQITRLVIRNPKIYSLPYL